MSYQLPSRPESVITRQLQHHESTGFEPFTYGNRKSLKSRRRSRVVHDIIREPTERFQNSLFAHFQKEAEKNQHASCVFLLWGSRNSETSPTWAVDVQTTGLENEEDIFQELGQRYSDERGILRRYFSFREYDKLEPITFRLICRSSEKFSVFMESLDLAKYRTIYTALRKEAGAAIDAIADFNSDIVPDFCFRDHSGKYEHDNGQCPVNSSSGMDHGICPFEQWDGCNDQLRWIDSARLMSCYFRNPVGACSQQILRGFDKHSFIHYYRNIELPQNSFQPQNRDISLAGLYLKTRLNIWRAICVCVGLVLFVVLGGKLVWNSWEIVFGAGSFVVAIPMLAMSAITYFEA